MVLRLTGNINERSNSLHTIAVDLSVASEIKEFLTSKIPDERISHVVMNCPGLKWRNSSA